MASVWDKYEAAWKSDKIALFLCILAALSSAALIWFVPLPGISVTVLGAVAAVMSLRPDMKVGEKAAWMLIVASLLYAEIRAIRRDRAEAESQALESRQEQNNAFKAIRDKQDQDFKDTADGLKDAIAGIRSTLKTTSETLKQTHPRAVLRAIGIDITNAPASPNTFQPNLQYNFNFSYSNNGNETGHLAKLLGKIYIGKPDDLETQKRLAIEFEKDWKELPTPPKALPVPPAGTNFWTEHRIFTDQEIGDLISNRETVYFFRRLEFTDSTGTWISDNCDHLQISKIPGLGMNLHVAHPCLTFQDDRYPEIRHRRSKTAMDVRSP